MTTITEHKTSGIALHWKMMIGFVVGIVLGSVAFEMGGGSGWVTASIDYVSDPIGQVFLHLLFMLVVPLVFSALILGVVEIGEPSALGRIGFKTLFYVVTISAIAVILGLVFVNTFQPGADIDQATSQALLNASTDKAADIVNKGETTSFKDVLLNIVPKNPIADAAAPSPKLIGVMFFALMFGIAAVMTPTKGVRSFIDVMQGVYDISLKLIDWVIQLAPYAIVALLYTLIADKGIGELRKLLYYVLVAVGAMAVHMFMVFPILISVLGKMSPFKFFKAAQSAILTAFSTSSSAATLPTTLRVSEEELGLPRRIGRFVCTLGATANMNGTALFEGVTVLFLAQYFGIDLNLGQQIIIVLMCVMGGIGAAGVPGGSLPVIASILVMFNIPPEGIGLILGVDRFLDMCRTTVNVTGDLVVTTLVAQGEAPDRMLATDLDEDNVADAVASQLD